MEKILDLNNIIGDKINYKNINNYGTIKLRNNPDGLTIVDTIYYKFLYSKLETTKQEIVASITYDNTINDKPSVTRRSFESKENNISTDFYLSLLEGITEYHNKNCIPKEKKEFIYIAIDGSSSNNNKQNVMLNMGYYDIFNKIPIDLTNNGTENRNKEVGEAIKYIKKNPEKFKDVVIIGDRLYFTYELMDFLVRNNIYFIIRAKGDATNLDKNEPLKKNIKDHDIIEFLRDEVRTIHCKKVFNKIFFDKQCKKDKTKKYYLEVTNDCVLITNLLDMTKYPDDEILNLYRQRWEIEIYFKYIKNNFKFQHMKEKDKEKYYRIYICEVIMTYILRIIEYFYLSSKNIKEEKKSKKDNNKKIACSVRVNNSLLTTGIFDKILYDILNSSLTIKKVDAFCKAYITVNKNDLDRHYPRGSKIVFSKWYVKGYSNGAEMVKIINAILERKIETLNKNLKLKASKIKITKTEII